MATDDLASAAASYDQSYDGFRADPAFSSFARAFLRDQLLPILPAHASLLDLGCGNGEFLAAAKEFGLRGLGWDSSEAAVELARSRGLDVVAGDLDGVVPARSFDIVTMWDVIEHVPTPATLLRSACRALRPGGWLLVKTPKISSLAVAFTTIIPRMAGAVLSVPAHIHFFGPRSLGAVLAREGFEIDRRIDIGATRAPTRGGGLGKEFRRGVARAIPRVLGCGNLLVLARRGAS